MRAFLRLCMRSRAHAMTVSAVSAVLSLLVFPLGYVSAAVIGLATLRFGAREGALVLGGALVLAGAFAWLAVRTPWPPLLLGVVIALPAWVLATVLRATGSLGGTLALAGLAGALGVLGMHVVLGEPAAWWAPRLEALLVHLFGPAGGEGVGAGPNAGSGPAGGWGEVVDALAPLMTGLFVGGILLGVISTVLLARWWHALLDRPGAFGAEFRDLRLPRWLAWLAGATAAATLALPGGGGEVARDLLLLWTVLYTLQGIAIVHALVARLGASAGWLVLMYVLISVVPQPSSTVLLALAIAGFVDGWLDIRGRVPARGGGRT